MNVKVSVVVTFLNNHDQVNNCIKSLLSGYYKPDEIILIDDGSKEKKRIRSRKVKYFYQKNQGPAAARNFGASKSKNKWIIFLDSDCWVGKNFFKKVKSLINLGQNFGGRYKIGIQKNTLSELIDIDLNYRYINMNKFVFFHGSYCMALEKKKFFEIRGFNNFFKKPGGEDFDLSYRYSKKYSRFYIPKSLTVYTYHEKKIIIYLKKIFYRALVHKKVYFKNKFRQAEDNYSSLFDKIYTIFLLFSIIFFLKLYIIYFIFLAYDYERYIKYTVSANKRFNFRTLFLFHIFNIIRSLIINAGLFSSILKKKF
jgi:glycosyltransferase involved in cell wall biosynthesis